MYIDPIDLYFIPVLEKYYEGKVSAKKLVKTYLKYVIKGDIFIYTYKDIKGRGYLNKGRYLAAYFYENCFYSEIYPNIDKRLITCK